MTPVDDSELLREKSLREIYLAARVIPVSRFNQAVSIAVAVALFWYACVTPEPLSAIATTIRVFADYSFAFATSILSFLIAGFTIYLSVTKPDLLVFLAATRNERSSLPEIKHVAFVFMRVMANFILFCLFCVAIKLFGGVNGPLSILIHSITPDPANAKLWLSRFVLAILGGGLVHLLMLLQSFVFNIYHTAMLAVVWERNPKH